MFGKMGKLGLVFLVLAAAYAANAGVYPLSIVPTAYSGLGTLQPIAGWDPMVVVMENLTGNNLLRAEVVSQAFLNADDNTYVYLYQVTNKGLNSTWHMIEYFTIATFYGAGPNTIVGYVTDNAVPAPFTAGTKAPLGSAVNTDTGPTISFGYPAFLGAHILPGQVSKVMYVKSELPPMVQLGNIINGAIADGPVVAPVPEPATISLLSLSGLALLLRRKRQ